MHLNGQLGSDDRYTAQRHMGFAWLRFMPDLEKEYRKDFITENAARIRIAGLIGLVAVVAFVVMDQFFGSNLQPRSADLLLLGLTVPGILVPLAATLRREPGVLWFPVMFCGLLLMGLSIVGVIYIGRSANAWFPWESLILVTMFIFFVSGLMFYPAVVCGAIVWVAFVASNWGLQRHDVLTYEAYYLAVANGIGWLGLYMLERQARLAFLLQRELSQQALSDPLTGLMNRRAFTSHLEAAWLQAQRGLTSIGVMLLDIDGFKRINDTSGHQFGDKTLQQVAAVLKASAMRPLDAAGRYGGDEFIAVWYDVDGSWFGKLVQELPGRFDSLERGDAKAPVKITVSGGAIVAWPRPGMAMLDAVKAADELLYETKRAKPGTIGFKVLRPPPSQQEKSAA